MRMRCRNIYFKTRTESSLHSRCSLTLLMSFAGFKMKNKEDAHYLNKDQSNDAREYCAEYCNNTTLHGLKYVGGEKRTLFEKFLWTFLFLFSLTTCGTLIYKTYIKWENNPVIISFSHEQNLIWKVPFPAVTICPFNKINATKYDNFKEKFDNNDDNTGDLIYICPKLKQTIRYEFDSVKDDIEDDVDEQPANTTESLIEKVIDIAPSIDILFVCEFNAKFVNCKDLFSPIMTEDGLCYNFNMMNSKNLFEQNVKIHEYLKNDDVSSNSEWSLERGFKITDMYPKPAISSGVRSGLQLILFMDKSEHETLCSPAVFGFKIFIHSPNDIPTATTRHVTVSPNEDVNIALTPDYITTDKELIKYPVEKRNCYFEHEKKLKFFKIYSQKNCELECLANLTLVECGCAQFYMPRESTTYICLEEDFQCIQTVEKKMSKIALNSENQIPCDCQPSCYSLDYKTATSQAPINFTAFAKTLSEAFNEIDDENSNETFTFVRIFQSQLMFTSKERQELNSATDLLANFGGLLGLFIGFSVLSLLEIFYYVSVRSWMNKLTVGKYCVPITECDN